MKQNKRRIFAGCVCDQIVYLASERRTFNKKTSKPRPRFNSDEERAHFNSERARRHFELLVNANFTPQSLYVTLTFSGEWECHTYEDAERLFNNYWRKLRYKFPDMKAVAVLGEGKGTKRIHAHMIVDGIPAEAIRERWQYGRVVDAANLREENTIIYEGKKIKVGRDYSALACYLFKHYTPKQGKGKRYKSTRNLRQPEVENATECVLEYSPSRPPYTPRGYKYVGCEFNAYGFMRFRYVLKPPPRGGTHKPCKCVQFNDEFRLEITEGDKQ